MPFQVFYVAFNVTQQREYAYLVAQHAIDISGGFEADPFGTFQLVRRCLAKGGTVAVQG